MFLNPHLWRSLQFPWGNRAASVVVSPHARFTFAASRRTATATWRSGAPQKWGRWVEKAALLSLQGTKQPPPRNTALLRVYQPLVPLNKALLTPYSWGGGVALGGVARIPLKQVRDLWMALEKCYVADGFAILLMLLGWLKVLWMNELVQIVPMMDGFDAWFLDVVLMCDDWWNCFGTKQLNMGCSEEEDLPFQTGVFSDSSRCFLDLES